MNDKTITSTFIEKDIIEHSKNNPDIKSLSDWINQTYRAAFMNIETEQRKLDVLTVEISEAKKRIEHLKSMENKLGISDHLFKWFLEEGLPRSKRVPELKPLLTFFNNSYGQDLNMKQFKFYLDLAKKKLEKK